MANYETLKAAIQSVVKTNGNNEITGALLQQSLLAMINSLGAGYQFVDIATPTTKPGTPDYNVFYIASTAGTYTNFNNLKVSDNELAILEYNGSWSKQSIDIVSPNSVLALDNKIADLFLYTASLTDQKLLPNSSWSGYRLSNVSGEIFQKSPTTDVVCYKIDAGKYFVITGVCSIDNAFCYLGTSGSAAAVMTFLRKVQGQYAFVGRATAEKQYVFTTVDKNSEFHCYMTDESMAEKISDLNEIINELCYVKTEITGIARTISNNRLNISDGTFVSSNQTTDVVCFNVGYNKKFLVTGTNGTLANQCGIAASVSPIRKPWAAIGYRNTGDYSIVGETNSQCGYVCITVDKNSEFHCYEMTPVNEALEPLISKVRRTIKIYKADTEVQILTKMLDAYESGNCDVMFENGTYTFAEIYIYMRDTLGWTWTMELPIGNNCRYYFNGSTLISNAPESAFSDSRNVLGCKAGSSNKMSYELYDGIIINNGGTYCVHDECLSGNAPYLHRYKNMQMQYNNGAATEGLSKCIGGGAGVNGIITIEDCVFENNNQRISTEDVSWHGIDGVRNCTLRYFVSGCYFSRSFRVDGFFKSGDSVFVKYNGNSAAAGPAITGDATHVETYIFNNETRV